MQHQCLWPRHSLHLSLHVSCPVQLLHSFAHSLSSALPRSQFQPSHLIKAGNPASTLSIRRIPADRTNREPESYWVCGKLSAFATAGTRASNANNQLNIPVYHFHGTRLQYIGTELQQPQFPSSHNCKSPWLTHRGTHTHLIIFYNFLHSSLMRPSSSAYHTHAMEVSNP